MKMRSAFIFVLSICLLTITSSVVFGQSVGASRGLPGSGSYTITGIVRLPDGNPAAGARVDVSCDYTNIPTSTESDGTYRVTGVPAGNCKVVVRVEGFDPITEHRQVTRDTPMGQAIYIPVFLRANPYKSPAFSGVPKAAVDKLRAGVEKAEKGDADGALALFDQAIALHPTFAPAHYQRGSILLKKNDLDKAIESFVKAIEIKPDYLEAKYGFGMAQFLKKNYEVSEAVFRDVIKQRADMSEAHLNLGISLFYLKKTDEAESELKSAIAGNGKLALGHLYLGQIYVQKKRNAEAAGELQKYVDLVPKAPNVDRVKSLIVDLKKQT